MAVERIFRWMDIIVVMVYWMVESGKWKVGWIFGFWILDLFAFWIWIWIMSDRFHIGTV